MLRQKHETSLRGGSVGKKKIATKPNEFNPQDSHTGGED